MFGLGGILPMIALLGALGGSVIWYYKSTQATIQQLRENNLVLEEANRTNQETMERMNEAMLVARKLNQELQDKYDAAESRVDSLRDKLIDHDLTNLSLKKPALIEKRINNGTAKAFEYLESITTVERVQSMDDTGADSGEGNQDQDNPD